MAPFHRPSKTCTAISRTWRKSAGSRSGGFSSPPLPCSLSFAPFVFRSRPRNGNGRLSVGAHCVQITTNHLFLWIVPRSAGSRIVPLLLLSLTVPSDFVLLLLRRGNRRERRGGEAIIPLVPFDLLPDSRASAPLRFVFRAADPFSPLDPSRKIMMTLLDSDPRIRIRSRFVSREEINK